MYVKCKWPWCVLKSMSRIITLPGITLTIAVTLIYISSTKKKMIKSMARESWVKDTGQW